MQFTVQRHSAGPHESLSMWENETAVLDMLICKVIHLCQVYVAFRWNLGPDMYINSKSIPGAKWHTQHLPALYSDRWKFDPA